MKEENRSWSLTYSLGGKTKEKSYSTDKKVRQKGYVRQQNVFDNRECVRQQRMCSTTENGRQKKVRQQRLIE